MLINLAHSCVSSSEKNRGETQGDQVREVIFGNILLLRWRSKEARDAVLMLFRKKTGGEAGDSETRFILHKNTANFSDIMDFFDETSPS